MLKQVDLKQIWETAKSLARDGINNAFSGPAGESGAAKEASAVNFVLERMESVDQFIPAVGQFLDLPFIDLAEKTIIEATVHEAVRLLVRQQYAVIQISKQLSEVNA